jgi:ATP-dependent Clp protease ATP-binding subunit ClpA
MMLERLTSDARTVVIHAQQHARRLGHRYIGCEHLLLALAASDQPASAVLRERGLTPAHVEEEIVRRAGLGAAGALFANLDRDALASIGIDLHAVRARIEASFGAEALTQAGQAVQPRPGPAGLVRGWRRRRRARRVLTTSVPAPAGRYEAADPRPGGYIPFTPGAKKCLQDSLREAAARHDTHIGVEHVALGLLATDRGLVPPILAALGVSAPALRAAILDRYRSAS